MTKISNLAMGRQSGVKYGLQPVVETIQYTGVGEKFSQAGVVLVHQCLNTCALVVGFS